MTYLITFTCYGNHMHGDEAGSVDRRHNVPGTPVIAHNPVRIRVEGEKMSDRGYSLDQVRREAVLEGIRAGCLHRGWSLLAAHVRSSHVHMVVASAATPEMIMNASKSYASKRLNELNLGEQGRKRWARHGSTRWLKQPESISAALRYVIEEQGEAMSVFLSEER